MGAGRGRLAGEIPVMLPVLKFSGMPTSPSWFRDPLATRRGHRGALRLPPGWCCCPAGKPSSPCPPWDTNRLLEMPDCRPAASVRYCSPSAALARDWCPKAEVLAIPGGTGKRFGRHGADCAVGRGGNRCGSRHCAPRLPRPAWASRSMPANWTPASRTDVLHTLSTRRRAPSGRLERRYVRLTRRHEAGSRQTT